MTRAIFEAAIALPFAVTVLTGRYGELSAAEQQTPEASASVVRELAAQTKFFETKIRPLLAAKCYKCHGPKKQSGGLRLDSQSTILKGGESGPALVKGNVGESILIEAIRWESFEMPPNGKLPDEEIELLTEWVADGAFWPEHDAVLREEQTSAPKITDEDRQWWAFQPVSSPTIPADDSFGWARNEIDHFILQSLQTKKLSPAPQADRRTLIRRVFFDLIGLPPSVEEVEAFVNDESADAYERLIDRLLDSPRYGERWGRHWLDLVRYSESDGYRADGYRPTMWRYRDWVIDSFNKDKPFNQFVSEQIAGDELDPGNPDAVVATAYWRLYLYEYNQRDVRGHWRAIIDELTDITGEAFLGMSLACAKCHDHKFDPILREDYFRFQAFFSSIEPRDDVPLATPDVRAKHDAQQREWETATQDIRDQIDAIKAPYMASKRKSAVNKFPPDVREIAKREHADWSAHERQLMNLVQRQIDFEYSRLKLNDEHTKKLKELEEQLAKFNHLKPTPLPVSFTVTDTGAPPAITYIPGDRQKADLLPARFSVLDSTPLEIHPTESAPNSTGRRTALAKWLTDPENPLSMRVIVNRIWQGHFGSGIVETSSDFGRLGEAPSHPELLDWLTTYFLDNGQHFKPLHRLILRSATYRQSAFNPDNVRGAMVDPRNRLRWRWDIQRLGAEQIRDAMLAVSGELDLKSGGSAVSTSSPRRSVYTKVVRNSPDPLLYAFDVADGFNSTAKRDVTTTPTQSLLMINGDWVLGRAKALTKRVDALAVARKSPGTNLHQQAVIAAWQLAWGREPTDDEMAVGTRFLSQSGKLKPTAPPVEMFAATQSSAARVRDDVLFVSRDAAALPKGDFTIEAIIELDSLFPDATVRTIASQWNGSTGHRGWNFGVTSAKSAYQPRNLILQLTGGLPAQAGTARPTYEVIASNLRPELNRPYYVAVSVDVDDATEAGVTFYMKDLSKPDVPIQSANVAHKVLGDYHSHLRLVIGGRDTTRKSRWDGAIDNIRLSTARLSEGQLLVNQGKVDAVAGFWKFDHSDAPGADSSGSDNDLQLLSSDSVTLSGIDASRLTDLCHVLLNSNEFLYVD